jgi:phage terminase large subunit GpA-like protein
MAVGFNEARKHPEMLKTWVNTSLGETWKDQGEEIESDGLMARRENWDADCIPDGVLVITAGADVQADRLEISIVGWGLDSQSYVIEHLIFWGETSQHAVWHELDEYLSKRYERETLPSLPIACVAIDSGYQTQSVYNFVKVRQGKRIFAIKGQSQAGKPICGKSTQSGRQRIQLFPAGVDTCKETLFSWLQVEEPAPGYIHFSNTCDEEYFKQLTAEKRAIKYIRGRKQVVWVAKRERNETLDCFNYSLVALHILQPNLERISDKLTIKDEDPLVKNQKTKSITLQRRKPQRKKSFIKDW